MSLFKKSALLTFAVFVIFPLAACESVERWTDSDDQIKVTSAAEPNKAEQLLHEKMGTVPGVQPVPSFPPPGDRDLRLMTSRLSGGSVEIYDLDGAPQNSLSGNPAPVMPDFIGIPSATDPRVTVYPVDGQAAYPGEMGFQTYSPQGAQREWPNAVLPMGHTASAGLTPPPDAFGVDRRMNIMGGKLSPREGKAVSNIYFPYGSASLDGSDRDVLNKVAETAKFAPVDRVNVEGHASMPTQTNDPVKAKILNLKESMNRAYAVSQTLIQKGVPAEKLKTVGWGDTKQASGNEAEQRRVDIFTGTGP